MKKVLFIILITLLLTSCLFGDNPSSYHKITSDFWLNWFEYNEDQHILFSTSENGAMGEILVESTVYAVGFDDEFIISKQHPNTAKKIMERVNDYDPREKAYYLKRMSDTIWLAEKDSIYEKNGTRYHKEYLNRGYLSDSLKPNKSITNYSIIDLRNYERGNRNFKIYNSLDKEQFKEKRNELGISSNLNFTITDKEFQ